MNEKKQINDGGPAFPEIIPCGKHESQDCACEGSYHGMTVRDYFAIHAPTAEINVLMRNRGITNRPEARYVFADAMIAEREK